ncbi:hypothetical protein ACFTQ7_17770, partial [Lysinibacillus sp. NPDC056959]|uniref:hypothetical protein n=1 Tax=Lysinibacillus sp. NPDC056959 TaxID=3345981 RepID=UPI003631D17F
CESEAAATNVLTVRKRSGSYKCFNCAKAKRQQQSAQSERKSNTRYRNIPKKSSTLLYPTIGLSSFSRRFPPLKVMR